MISYEHDASSSSLLSSNDDKQFWSPSTICTAKQDDHCLNDTCSDSKSDESWSSSSSTSARKHEIECSSLYEDLSQTVVCDETVDETNTSSIWSHIGIVYRTSRDSWIRRFNKAHEECFFNPLRMLQTCSFCFQPPLQECEHGRHNDCFLAVDRSSILSDERSHCSRFRQSAQKLHTAEEHESTPCRVQFDPKTKKSSIFTPLAQKILSCKRFAFQNHSNNGQNHAAFNTQCLFTEQYSSVTPLRQTPITVGSSTKNGGTSSNTLHRRVDISAGFFTFATLEAIHSFARDESLGTIHSPSNESENRRANDDNRSAFKTPAARPRLNSELFRNTIGEVTCEKRANSEDDVSPIESEEEFSLMINAEGRKSEMGTQSKSPFTSNIQKRLNYDDSRDVNEEMLVASKVEARGEVDLSDDVSAEKEVQTTQFFPEFGAKVIETIQALIPKTKGVVHQEASVKEQKESLPQPITKEGYSRQHLYMPKSISFIKALRKNGRSGKCLIQGWIAFRQSLSWREISQCTRRCDFRYIVLLDDMPLLHIFGSKSKQRRGEPKPNLLTNCVTFDLTKDVEAGVTLASKQLGHEVYLVESETNELLCSMLPVGMKNLVFLDKHKSRLAKGDVLGNVFRKTPSSTELTFQDNGAQPRQRVLNNTHATNEQNDASRHLLFVLSAAIAFPPPREDKTIGK
ncbi:hypothetical protein HJC23_002991 [Cyclotella cryptica]|uniref:Uncharacterized protein n=1 Tax=Cyclotella cryptica TaxID=29204 RepID=A0ABD3PT85_9STRA|eukprot:CCRYP_011797-RA/>CCRYP_011797-RA protein AED:0.06 eAED:0.05 QI:0/-1/0/1/-1/1/1/0/684